MSSRGRDRVQVAVRVRPFTPQERGSLCCIDVSGNSLLLTSDSEERRFDFDHCFWSHDEFLQEEGSGKYVRDSPDSRYSDQDDVYETLGETLLDNAFNGYNACVFAYGYTGSGKSYSMVGTAENKGLMPLLCQHLFERINASATTGRKCQVEVSIFELYNERIYDLLNPARDNEVKNTSGPFLFGVSSRKVPGEAALEEALAQGMMRRTLAATSQNDTSSRAHTVYRINLRQVTYDPNSKDVTKELDSDINLVDLAGAERVGAEGVRGERFTEGLSINKSLLTLERVINALVERHVHIPYRDSRLTHILQNALGGNSKTAMLATVSPSLAQYQETLSTLQYAQNVKNIENNAVVNFRQTGNELARLRQEVVVLRKSLEESERMRLEQQELLKSVKRPNRGSTCCLLS